MAPSVETAALDRERPFRIGAERRFPLHLTFAVPPIRDAYERSLVEAWDPEDEAHWTGFDPREHDESARRAGASVWSHLAWVEFPAIAESEAVLVRACLEPDIDVDLKYCLSMRAVERARSTDLAHIVARRLHGYEPVPAGEELALLLDDELVRRALHADSDLDAYIAAHLGAQATVDLVMWERTAQNARGALGDLAALVVRDKARMLDVAWAHLELVVPRRDEAGRRMIADAVDYVVEVEERRGRRVPALLAPGADREHLLEAHAIAAAAGLGGVPEADQREAVESALAEVAARLSPLGIEPRSTAVAGR
jgi:hypothetical protein